LIALPECKNLRKGISRTEYLKGNAEPVRFLLAPQRKLKTRGGRFLWPKSSSENGIGETTEAIQTAAEGANDIDASEVLVLVGRQFSHPTQPRNPLQDHKRDELLHR
jgi:hypothetical protein